MIQRVTLLVAVAFLPSCHHAERNVAQVDTVLVFSTSPASTNDTVLAGSPLVAADFVVAGLHAGMDSVAVRHLLGSPDSVAAEDDFRDPGAKLISWHYRDLIVLLGSYNRLGGIAITGPHVATARGLRVGDTQERVQELYGRPDSEYEGDWQYEYRGDAAGLTALQINFVDGRVKEIYLGHLYD